MSYLVVFATLTVLIASSSCDSDCEGEQALIIINTDECSYYYDLLENALLNDSDNVYRLQRAFFPPNGDTPSEVDIGVTIIVGEIVSGGSCDDDCSPSFSYGEYGTGMEWTQVSGDLDNSLVIITDIIFSFAFEPVIFLTFQYLSFYYDVDGYDDSNYCDIELELDQLPCNPCSDTTYDTLAHIMTWVRIQLLASYMLPGLIL